MSHDQSNYPSTVLIESESIRHQAGMFREILQEAGFLIEAPEAEGRISPEVLLRSIEATRPNAIIMGVGKIGGKEMDASPELRVIARTGVGYDGVDLEAATHRGIAVTITPGANHEAVAEHTFAMILALSRHLVIQDRAVREGRWERTRLPLPLRGRRLGLVGLGRIGKAVADRGRAFGMKLLASAPRPRPHPGVQFVSLDELFATSDIVSLHLPLTDETSHLVDRTRLETMRPGAILINTSRGGLVREPDLIEVLRSGRISAGLDVFDPEPPRFDNPLWSLDNLLVTPHLSGIDQQGVADMASSAARSIVGLRDGSWPAEAVVNPRVKDLWRWT